MAAGDGVPRCLHVRRINKASGGGLALPSFHCQSICGEWIAAREKTSVSLTRFSIRKLCPHTTKDIFARPVPNTRTHAQTNTHAHLKEQKRLRINNTIRTIRKVRTLTDRAGAGQMRRKIRRVSICTFESLISVSHHAVLLETYTPYTYYSAQSLLCE